MIGAQGETQAGTTTAPTLAFSAPDGRPMRITGYPRQPVDATGGEIAIAELRPLVRRIADTVGKAVAARVQEQTAPGGSSRATPRRSRRSPACIASSTTTTGQGSAGLAPAVGARPRRRGRRGDRPRLRARRAGRTVGPPGRGEHRRQRPRQRVGHVRRRREGALDADRGRPGRADRPDPPGRPPARPQRGRVRRPPPAARPAAARRLAAVRGVRRRQRATASPPSRRCASAATAIST